MSASRTILITGVSSGIGRSLALEFARKGDRVVGLARDRKRLKALEGEIRAAGGNGIMLPCDVRVERQVRDAVKKGTAGRGVDILINNAGVTSFGDFLSTPVERFSMILDTNLKGAMIVTRAVLPLMVKRRKGAIMSIVSYAAKTVYQGSSAYSAAKSGLAGMMNVIREEIRSSGVKVMNVYPGAILTPMWSPKQRSLFKNVMIPSEDFAAMLYDLTVQPDSMTLEEVVVRPPIGDLRV
ncbi:MAG: SDR family oxidoreductase [Bacteroidota bacterium]